MTPEEAIKAVERAPSGPRIGAFFDLDGTLVKGYTAEAFWVERVRSGQIGTREFGKMMIAALDGNVLGGNPTTIGDLSVAGLRGHPEDQLIELGERLFVQQIAGTIRPQARQLVKAHLRARHTVAVSSAATRFQIEPVARDLGIGDILCTELEAVDGILTGKVRGKMLWGEPKAQAVRRFAKAKGIDLKASYAYANGDEDVAFLASTGHPHAVNPHRGLVDAARSQDWPILILREPKKAGLRSLLGTVGAMAALNIGMGVGAALGILNSDRRFGINAGIPLACDAALALSGVRLRVIGEHNLWRARPAIFVGNHQSSLDPIVVGSLLRKDFTAVGKKEAQYDPRTLLGGLLLDPAFIDRSNPEKAIAELDKLGERIRAGTSIMIFPEGTRTPTPELGRFKKGAFHIALQAGVPMVPIVLRNTGELMWHKSKLVHSGTVDVCVLDPISTDDWKVEDLNRITGEVRQLFADTLEKWPGNEEAADGR